MPELPDVELFRRRSRRAFGRRVARLTVAAPRLLRGISGRRLAKVLEGNRFGSSRRHGKYLFLGLARGGALALHFGMTGALVPLGRGVRAPPHTRLRLDFADGSGLAYTSRRLLGRIGLTDDVREFVAAHGLGPDALDRRFDRRAFERMLESRRAATPIKAVLMDQSLMAGIGNLYADEICFQAKVHPLASARGLTPARARLVYRSIKRVLRTAIECGADAEHLAQRLPRGYLLRVRDRDGRCPRCRARLATFKLAGRTGYCCPRCQPTPRTRGERSPGAQRGAARAGRGRKSAS